MADATRLRKKLTTYTGGTEMVYAVIVGGWRLVGTYSTYQEAEEKKNTCISSIVQIIEMEE